MPANMDDPASPTIYRRSGAAPFPDPNLPPCLPADILPRQVTLRDRFTKAVIVPFASQHQVPTTLLAYLCDQFNKEIEGGDTYPLMDLFSAETFASYWFQNFGAVMLLGETKGPEAVVEGKNWSKECLGSFYIKPNYPGRSSHVCSAGFLVTDASRNRGVGRLMGEAYIAWAPRLGYTYSVFNLVYETNVASCRIWDALGFKRIGRVKGCGNLKSYPDRLIDAIIYGRDLKLGESEEPLVEERFDKIKFYLKYGKYPNGSDRAEKSRLRSAATHYKLLDDDKLMLKDKEVISDPVKQYDIARTVHIDLHAGINKTTAIIAEKYHWSRIKETVSDVIRNCNECKDSGKTPNPGGRKVLAAASSSNDINNSSMNTPEPRDQASGIDGLLGLRDDAHTMMPTLSSEISSIPPQHTLRISTNHHHTLHHHSILHEQEHQHHYQPIDPQIISQQPSFDQYHARDFQALLNATEDDIVVPQQDSDSVDRDLEMLIEHQDDDEDGRNGEVLMGEDVSKDAGIYDITFEDGAG